MCTHPPKDMLPAAAMSVQCLTGYGKAKNGPAIFFMPLSKLCLQENAKSPTASVAEDCQPTRKFPVFQITNPALGKIVWDQYTVYVRVWARSTLTEGVKLLKSFVTHAGTRTHTHREITALLLR